MKIEVGKKYRRRDGTVVEIAGFTPMGHPCARDFPFIAEGEGGYTYAVDGRYVGFVESEFDLVEEITDEQAASEAVEGPYVDALRNSFPPARYQALNGPEKPGNSYGEIIRQEQLKDRALDLAEAATPRDITAITAIEQAMRGLGSLHREAVIAWFRARYPEAPF